MKLHVALCIILLLITNTISTIQIPKIFDDNEYVPTVANLSSSNLLISHYTAQNLMSIKKLRNTKINQKYYVVNSIIHPCFISIKPTTLQQWDLNSPYQSSDTLSNRYKTSSEINGSLFTLSSSNGLNASFCQIIYICVYVMHLLLYIMSKRKKMDVVSLIIISLSLFIIKTSAQTLDTTMIGGNSQNGNMFDICALSNVEITRFDINCYAEGPSVPIEIYVANSVTQVYSAISNTPSAWTKIHTETVTCQPKGTLTILNSFNQNAVSVKILENNCRGFYITRTDAGTLSYTAGSAEGAVYALNADIQFKEGIGVSYPFGDEFTPRIWNGRIHYILFITTNPTLSPTIFTNNPSYTNGDVISIGDTIRVTSAGWNCNPSS
eukprot:322282_1